MYNFDVNRAIGQQTSSI